ncbi:hypothetical protein M0Q97_11750 [Candidatus Dojkabacteria bacterium]|jgi:hypothetical protein|nr:hypothetical protein [Candidatus Dojkabacteria bacterium]
MKHLKLFEEYTSQQLEIPFSDKEIQNNQELIKLAGKDNIVYESKNFIVVKPRNYDDVKILFNNTEWNEEYYKTNFNIYINIDKRSDEKTLFNFYNSEFIDKDDDNISLCEFFEENSDLLLFYGDIVNCNNTTPAIIEENNEYWAVTSGYEDYADFYNVGHNTRKEFIPDMLRGDSFEYFEYESKYYDIDDYGIKPNDENLIYLKIILLLEAKDNDYDYDITEISDYDDIVEIINDYDIDELKDYLKRIICEANENADADAAYDKITDYVYDFFNLEPKSAKWQTYKNNDSLWIKFKSKLAACNAKMVVSDLDDSYSENDKTTFEFSSPHNGYGGLGDNKNKNDYFNSGLSDTITEYDNVDSKVVELCYKNWNELKDLTQDEIFNKIDILMKAKKYNI